MVGISYAQAEGLWIKAGGDPAVAPIAAAIVFPESGGNPSAVNPTDDGGRQSSFGLWQISNGTHTPPDPNWADPLTNAKLAVGKYKGAGNSFSPWGTYDSGAYRRYVQNGVPPDMSAGGAGGVTGVPDGGIQLASSGSLIDPSTWITGIGNLLGQLGNYAFLGLVLVGGSLLMLVGLLMVIRDNSAGASATSVLRLVGAGAVARKVL
jgi:hypothetical protein